MKFKFHQPLRVNKQVRDSKGDRITGSMDIPLSSDGKEESKKLGSKLAASGKLDRIYHSPMKRAKETTDIASQNGAGPVGGALDGLRPWALGSMENLPEAALNSRVRGLVDTPDKAATGKAKESTREGESFNTFKHRTLTTVGHAMAQHSRNPSGKIGLITHSRNIKLVHGWAKKGFNSKHEIDNEEMFNKDGDKTGAISHLSKHEGKWQVKKHTGGQMKSGIYLISHSRTEHNHN